MSTTPSARTYVLGHADVEVQRLLLQGRLYNDYTEHALRLAGLRPGMRVLDIGEFVPRFREEALAANGLITMPSIITAWTKVQK